MHTYFGRNPHKRTPPKENIIPESVEIGAAPLGHMKASSLIMAQVLFADPDAESALRLPRHMWCRAKEALGSEVTDSTRMGHVQPISVR